jgi:peptide/nickel transport system substrate-binding protein
MKSMSKVPNLAIAMVAMLALGACGGGATGPTALTPVKGGTMTVAVWQEPNTLYPYYATQTVSTLVYEIALEGLVRVTPDGAYQPVLAKEVPTVANGGLKLSTSGQSMDVTYHLKPGLKWADGQPVTSDDVRFTWQAIMKDPKVTTRGGYDQITSIDTPDPVTAVVHYGSIYAPYASRFSSSAGQPILPRHVLEKEADISKSDFVRTPSGTGPFKITEFKSADHITAERNPNYREAGKPYLDRIIFRSVPSREVALAQLKAGEVDAMWNLLEAQLPDIEKQTDIKVRAVTSPSVERLEFNLAKPGNPADQNVPHPVLGDVNMRHALVLATPKRELVSKLLFGKATVAQSTLSIGWAAPRDVHQDDYNPTKAKQVLDQAGWVAGSDGIRVKNGVRASLKITTTTGDQIREEIEQVLVDRWRQIGVALEVSNIPSSVLFGSWSANAPRKKGNFDINMYASSPDIDPHETVAQRFACANIPRPENNGLGFNYYRYCDSQTDQLIQQAGSIVDQDKRKQLYSSILKRLNDAQISVWLYNRSNIDAYRFTVGGYKDNGWDNLTWNTEDWFVSKK